ncbi:MAG: proton-conducting transporter membrane subunit [Ferruginibacter sp.]
MLPFSSWLPRAMEGPTTSSAVFYGSLSLHLGAFLLIRTYPFWENILSVKVAVIIIGLLTAVIASMIAKVQSSVKTQIAYSSVTQMGFIFIEVALGLHWLALLHFVGNAFLRTYQLLVSPSVLSYEIHDMVFNYKAPQQADHKSSLQKMKNALYLLSVKEWNMDRFQYRFLWNPFKIIGRNVTSFQRPVVLFLLGGIFLIGIYHINNPIGILSGYDGWLPFIYALVGMLFVLQSFAHRGSANTAWLFIVAGQCFITLAIVANGGLPVKELLFYFSGIVPGAITGLLCLNAVYKKDRDISLNIYHGYNYELPKTGFVFLLSCLCMLGFPITATFLGIDLLFTHIHADQPVLIIFITISFIFIEIALLRIYSRIFLGMHKKNYHPIAFRSS